MTIRLRLLFALLFFSICVFGSSIPEIPYPSEHAHSISSMNSFVSYWDMLLYIFCLILFVPFVYIGYLKILMIPDKYMSYHFKGEYNAKNIIAYIEKLEVSLNRRFPKFKKSIEECEKDSAGDLRKYAEAIDSNLFCIKLNGQKRLTVFWNFSDTFLKVIILLLPVVGVSIVLVSYLYFGLSGLVLSLIPQIFIMPLMLTIFSYFLAFFQYVFRKTGKEVPALSLALFAVDALINRKAERTLDKKTGEYFYYSTVSKYNNLVNEYNSLTGIYIDPNPNAISGVLEDYTEEIN